MTKQGNYIAWLNGCSVMRGTLAECEAKALATFQSEAWRKRHQDIGKPTVLRITKGARQTLVSESNL